MFGVGVVVGWTHRIASLAREQKSRHGGAQRSDDGLYVLRVMYVRMRYDTVAVVRLWGWARGAGVGGLRARATPTRLELVVSNDDGVERAAVTGRAERE